MATHSRPPCARRSGRAGVGNALTRLLGRGYDKTAAAEAGPAADATDDTSEATAQKQADKPQKPKKEKTAKEGGSPGRFGAWLGRPMTSFHLIIAVAGLLTTLGLIMVLSASGVRSYDADGSAWVIFGKQVLWTVIGLFACYASLRMSVRFIRRLAFTGYVVTVILLVLVLEWASSDEREQRRRDRAADIKGSAEADAYEAYNAMLARLADGDRPTQERLAP